jgi:hypothetical protein
MSDGNGAGDSIVVFKIVDLWGRNKVHTFFRKEITVTKLDADVAVAPAILVLDYDGYRNLKIIEYTNRD